MRKLFGLTLAGLLGLAGVGTAMAQEAVLGDAAYADYEKLSAEVKIDMARALLAESQANDEMSRLSGDGEAVLGESVRQGALTEEQLQEMLAALRAKAELNDQMANPNQ
jgi:hypothetical protein